jgi:hypothetical protein
MDSTQLLDRLVQAEILTERADGDAIEVSDAVETAVANRLEESEELVVPADCPEAIGQRPELVAVYLSAREAEPDLSAGDLHRVTLLIDQLRRGYPPTEGAPEGFMPIHGDRLPVYASLHAKTVAYVWDHDCDPCDLMAEELGELTPETGDETALVAIFGPDNADVLYDEYGVEGAPTTLFLLNGHVDTRLFGTSPLSDIRKHLSVLEELRQNRQSA